jgi:hypothetical protein
MGSGCNYTITNILINYKPIITITMESTTNQKELMKIVIDSGVNIVTCGQCGDVLLHRLSDEEVTCPLCDFTSDPCDFPDLIIQKNTYTY